MTKKVDIRLYAGALSKIQELQAKLSGESFVSHEHYAALQLERDQLAARVAELMAVIDKLNVEQRDILELSAVLSRTPAASLARHDAGVLREFANWLESETIYTPLLDGVCFSIDKARFRADRIEQEADK